MNILIENHGLIVLGLVVVLLIVLSAYIRRLKEHNMLTMLDSIDSGSQVHESVVLQYAKYYDCRPILGASWEFVRWLIRTKYLYVNGDREVTITHKGEQWLEKYKRKHYLPMTGP